MKIVVYKTTNTHMRNNTFFIDMNKVKVLQ